MNDDVPLSVALLLGSFIGLLLYGPVQRWICTFARTLRESRRPRRPGSAAAAGEPRKRTGALLLIFATMHPAPWLLLVGVPYALYRLWNDPLRLMWACLLAGALLAPALLALGEAALRWRVRRQHE